MDWLKVVTELHARIQYHDAMFRSAIADGSFDLARCHQNSYATLQSIHISLCAGLKRGEDASQGS